MSIEVVYKEVPGKPIRWLYVGSSSWESQTKYRLGRNGKYRWREGEEIVHLPVPVLGHISAITVESCVEYLLVSPGYRGERNERRAPWPCWTGGKYVIDDRFEKSPLGLVREIGLWGLREMRSGMPDAWHPFFEDLDSARARNFLERVSLETWLRTIRLTPQFMVVMKTAGLLAIGP